MEVRLAIASAVLLVAGIGLEISWLWAVGAIGIFGSFLVGPRSQPAREALPPPPLMPGSDLVGVEVDPPRCDDCRFFDLAEGQRTLEEHPHFPSWFLGPDQMSSPVETDTGPDGVPIRPQPSRTQERLGGRAHTWKQYGVCGKHLALVNQFDVCDEFHRCEAIDARNRERFEAAATEPATLPRRFTGSRGA